MKNIIEEDQEVYVNAGKVAITMDSDPKTVISMIKRGEIRGKQFGNVWKVFKKDHERLIDPDDSFGRRETAASPNLDVLRSKNELDSLLGEGA